MTIYTATNNNTHTYTHTHTDRQKYLTLVPLGEEAVALPLDFVVEVAAFLGGSFFAATDGITLGFFMLEDDAEVRADGMGGLTFGNRPPFFLLSNSGCIFGSTPPDAMVTCFSN